MTPEDWLAQRTYRGADVDPDALKRQKRDTDTRVSVVLPALNVADTVGDIVDSVRRHWMDATPLVDEVLVIDGQSTDATAARATEAGAQVVREGDLLRHVGPGQGKGEALWKSLHAASGDVIVWLDSDVIDFDPAFVPGMLHPLLTDAEVGYVKALYHRKLGDSDEGGRVTEICARPLVNMFYPELTVLAQPLSGEAAGRRSLLERVPFMSGYAVEIGLLIDVLTHAGLGAIAQVDLTERRHTNQSTAALGRMAYAIMRAVLHRADGRALTADGPYHSPRRDGEVWTLDAHDVIVTERPPIATLPAYRERHPAR